MDRSSGTPPTSQARKRASATGRSVLGPTVVMKGQLSLREDLLVRGEIEGSVVGADTVVIARGARVKGYVSADHVFFERGFHLDDVVLRGHIAQTEDVGGHGKGPDD